MAKTATTRAGSSVKTPGRTAPPPAAPAPSVARPASTSIARGVQEDISVSANARTVHRGAIRNAAQINATAGKGRLKVRATQIGYYDNDRKRVGDVFTIDAKPLEEDVIGYRAVGRGLDGEAIIKPYVMRKKGDIAAFSERWMELADARTAESRTSANEAIRQVHDEIVQSRRMAGLHTGPDDVPADLPDTHDNPLGAD